jgi:exosortase
MTPNRIAAPPRPLPLAPLAALTAGLLGVLWAYWTTFAELADHWGHDPQYSHGWLVPGFALLLLWLRRDTLRAGPADGSWWGVAFLVPGLALRLVGAYFYYVWLDPLSLLPCLVGLVLLAGGWRALRWAWPAVAFLLFMIPLPYRVSIMMAGPLQGLATVASTFLLQTLGFPALAEGNVILLNEVELGIVEACSGLRMLVIFFALATGLVLLIRRPLWEKLTVVASAIPIALVVNVLRITVTGILYETAGSAWAKAVFHDLAGWLMMPLALGLLAAELHLLKCLLLEPVAAPERLRAAVRQPAVPKPPPPPGPRPSRRRSARVA